MGNWNRVPLIAEGWRIVSNRRARKLRKRGEQVQWQPELHAMAWLPKWRNGGSDGE